MSNEEHVKGSGMCDQTPLTDVQVAVQKTWKEAADYIDSRPCLDGPCRQGMFSRLGFFSRIPEDPRRHNMNCPLFMACVLREYARDHRENCR